MNSYYKHCHCKFPPIISIVDVKQEAMKRNLIIIETPVLGIYQIVGSLETFTLDMLISVFFPEAIEYDESLCGLSHEAN